MSQRPKRTLKVSRSIFYGNNNSDRDSEENVDDISVCSDDDRDPDFDLQKEQRDREREGNGDDDAGYDDDDSDSVSLGVQRISSMEQSAQQSDIEHELDESVQPLASVSGIESLEGAAAGPSREAAHGRARIRARGRGRERERVEKKGRS